MVTAGEVAGTLTLDTAPLMSGFDAAEARVTAFLALVQPLATVPIGADASAFTAALQQAAAEAQALTVAQTQQAAATAQATTLTQAQTAVLDEANAIVSARLANQQAFIAGLQQEGAAQSGAAAGSREASAALAGLGGQVTTLSTTALPGMGAAVSSVTSLLSAGVTTMRQIDDETRSFSLSAAVAGGSLVAAGAAVAGGFFAIFSSGLTTLQNTATTFDLTIAEAAGLGAALQSVGLPADSAQMALRQMAGQAEVMNNQIDAGAAPTGRLASGLRAIGVDGTDASGHVQQLGQLLPAVFSGFQQTALQAQQTGTRFDAAGVAAELFGMRAGPRMVPLLMQGVAGWQQYTDEAEKAGIGSADQVANLDRLHDSTAATTLELQGMAMKIGSDVAPAATTLISLVGGIANAFSQLSPWERDLIITLPLAAGGMLLLGSGVEMVIGFVGPLVAGTVEFVSGLAAMATEEGIAAAASEGLGVALDTMLPEIALFGAIAAGITLLIRGYSDSTGDAAGSTTHLATAAGSAPPTMEVFAQGLMAVTVGAKNYDKSIQDAQKATEAQVTAMRTAGLTNQQIIQTLDDLAAKMAAGGVSSDAQRAALIGLNQALGEVMIQESHVASGTAALTTAQDQLAAGLGITETAATAVARAHQTLEAAVSKASQSQADAQQFSEAYAHAASDAALSDTEWAKRKVDLEAATKGSNAAEAEAAKLELALAPAVRDLGVAAADTAVKLDQQTDAATRLGPALRQVATDVQAAATAGESFGTQLAGSAAASASAFAASYGAGAQAAAGALRGAAADALTAWQGADAQLIAADKAYSEAVEHNADAVTLARLKNAEDDARQTVDLDKQALTDRVNLLNGYLSAVQQAAQREVTLRGEAFDAQLKLTHLTAEEQHRGLGDRLQAEIATVDEIQKLETQLAATTDAATRATLAGEIAADDARLANIKEDVREIGASITADLKLDKIDLAAVVDPIKAATQAQNDLNATVVAGNAIAKQEDDLTKQVGASKQLTTQAELDGLHAVTEADRARAAGDVAASSAAQQQWAAVVGGYDAATHASRAYSQAEIQNAQATAKAASDAASGSMAAFNEAFTRESSARSALDQQLAASAAAEKQYATDRRSYHDQDLKDVAEFNGAMVLLAGSYGAAQQRAATAGLAAFRSANAAVLEDDVALNAQLSQSDRAYYTQKRERDLATQADAADTFHKLVTEAQAEAKGEVDALRDARAEKQSLRQLEIDDVTGAAAGSIAAYQAAADQIVAIDKQLQGPLDEDTRAQLGAKRDMYTQIGQDALTSAQDQVKDEKTIVDAHRSAAEQIISLEGNVFDEQHHLTHMTAEEKQAGLGKWLQAEIDTDNQIIALQQALANATDAITIASITKQIADLKPLADYYKLMVHEAETGAQDIKNWEDSQKNLTQATVQGGSIMAETFSTVTAAVQTTADVVQGLQDRLNAMMGVVNQPSTEELKLTEQLDRLKIAIAQTQEQGGDTTALDLEEKAIAAQVTAYQNERTATLDLAKAHGDLASGMTNSIATMRGAIEPIATLEEALHKAQTTTVSLYGTTTAAQAWASGTAAAVDTVTKAFTALSQAQQSASGTGPTGSPSPSGGGQSVGGAQGGSLAAGAGGVTITGGGVQGLSAYASTAGQSQGITVPAYALGTDRVPTDGLAYLHKDETVLPPGMPIGGQGGPYRGGLSIGTLSMPVTVQGTNLSPEQVRQAVRQGASEAIDERFNRDTTLGGYR